MESIKCQLRSFFFFHRIADSHPQLNRKAQSATHSKFRKSLTATSSYLLHGETIPTAPHPLIM